MRRIVLAFLAGFLPTVAAAQQFPQSLPANTVLGRLGVGPGPVQQIPFSQLGPNLITNFLAVTAPLSISGLNLFITGGAGKVLYGNPPAFSATPQLGLSSLTTGTLTFANASNTGTVTISAPSTATNWNLKFPTTAGSNGQALITDGSGNTSWAAGAGTVNSGTAGQVAYYPGTAAAVSGNAALTFSGAIVSIPSGLSLGGAVVSGQILAVTGTSLFNSGVTMGAALTYGGVTLSNAVTGTGNMVLSSGGTLAGPTITSPAISGATITTSSINGNAITTGTGTLTLGAGKTLTDTSGVGASVLLGATGGGFSAYAGASCTNQFIRSLSAAAAATCASVANTDLSNSSITIGSTNVSLGGTAATIAGLTLTAPTINGGTHTALTSLGIRSTGTGAFDLTLANSENLTAGRTLTLTLNNAPRTISLSGNVTTAADFTTAGANTLTLTTTGTTNVTLPTTGTLAVQNAVNTFSAINTFTALQQFTDIKFSSGKLYPTADSTTALQVTKADGTTRVMDFDTTNARVGINKTPGAFDLDVSGAVNIDGALTFGTGTITGLTVNNAPNSANDYLLYYNAASGAIRRCTVGSCAAAATAGVSSLNGLTGGLSVVAGTGIGVAAGGASVTVSLSTARQTLPTVQSCASGLTCDGSSHTYTTAANALWIEVRLVGPGGGGAGNTATTCGGSGANGSTASVFGSSVLTANVGVGGNCAGASGGGGTATVAGGALGRAYSGADGSPYVRNQGTFFVSGASGGGSCIGGAGAGGAVGAAGGAAKSNTGGGGGGAGNTGGTEQGAAGGGAGGCVMAIINSPSATYSYTVGSGGAGGTGTNAGGVGAAGDITVIEHYN